MYFGIHAFLMRIVVACSFSFLSSIPGHEYYAIYLHCLLLVEIRIWAIRNATVNTRLQCDPQHGDSDVKCRISGSDSRVTTSEFAFLKKYIFKTWHEVLIFFLRVSLFLLYVRLALNLVCS